MTHLLCPLCGKYSAFSSLISNELEPELKAFDFKGRGRGKGFTKGEEYSIWENKEYTTIIANRVEKLYNLFIDRGLLYRTIDVSTLNMIRENTELKRQLSSKNFRVASLEKENEEKDNEIEELELRSHVDYIILESLSLPKSEKLEFDDDSYNMVITSGTTALFLFLYFLVQEIPVLLRTRLLSHVNFQNPALESVLKNIPKKRTVAEELMGDNYVRFRGLDYTGKDPYTLKLSELKKIVNRVKERVFNPKEEMEKILKETERLTGKK